MHDFPDTPVDGDVAYKMESFFLRLAHKYRLDLHMTTFGGMEYVLQQVNEGQRVNMGAMHVNLQFSPRFKIDGQFADSLLHQALDKLGAPHEDKGEGMSREITMSLSTAGKYLEKAYEQVQRRVASEM